MRSPFSSFLLLAHLCACQAALPQAGNSSADATLPAEVDAAPMDAHTHTDGGGPAVTCFGSPDAVAGDAADVGTSPPDAATETLTKDPAFDAVMDPNVDQLLQVPVAQIDLSKDFVLTATTVVPALQHFFVWGLQPGQVVPDFRLWTLEGKQVSLSDWQGKANVLLVLGTPSCGEFRGTFSPQLPKLQAFADALTAQTGEKLQVLIVLAIEAHPALDPSPYVGQQWTSADNVADKILVRQPTTFGTRVLNGRAYAKRYNMNAAQFLVDGLDGAVWQELGALPNTAHLIDKHGLLVWKEPWALQTGKSDTDPTVKPELYAQVAKLLGGKP